MSIALNQKLIAYLAVKSEQFKIIYKLHFIHKVMSFMILQTQCSVVFFFFWGGGNIFFSDAYIYIYIYICGCWNLTKFSIHKVLWLRETSPKWCPIAGSIGILPCFKLLFHIGVWMLARFVHKCITYLTGWQKNKKFVTAPILKPTYDQKEVGLS